MSMAASSETNTGANTMSEKMKATNPYLQRNQGEAASAGQLGIEAEMAEEATWLDGNKNEVQYIHGDTSGCSLGFIDIIAKFAC